MRLTLRLRAFDFFRRTVARERVTLKTGNRPRTLENRNTLVRLPVVTGVKTGHTQQAGYVLIGSARKGGITLISAVLGAPSVAAREADTRKLFAWAFKRYQRVRAIPPGEVLARAAIKYRRGAELVLVVGDTSRRFVVRRGQQLRTLRPARAERRRRPDHARAEARRGRRLPRQEASSPRCRWSPRPTCRRPRASPSAPRIASRGPGPCSWSLWSR